MNLSEVESYLAAKRRIMPVTGYGKTIPQLPVLKRIEAGEPYMIRSLFAYLRHYNQSLVINERKISTPEELGLEISKIINSTGIPKTQLEHTIGIKRNNIYKLTRGLGNRVTLSKFLEAFNINLEIH